MLAATHFPVQFLQPAITLKLQWNRHASRSGLGLSLFFFSSAFALLGIRIQTPSPSTVLFLLPRDVWWTPCADLSSDAEEIREQKLPRLDSTRLSERPCFSPGAVA